METLAVAATLVILLGIVITRINSRYEKTSPSSGDGDEAGPEAVLQAAWDEFAGDEPLELARRRIDRLLRVCAIEELTQKSNVVQLAVMATRAERFDLLPTLADRAEELDAHCGETRSLRVLSELYHGDDVEHAKRLFADAQQVTAGCSKCSASLESKLLGTEISIAAELFEQRMSDRESPQGFESPHGTLTVRRA